MKRLRVELLRKRLDLFFIDQVRVTGESLSDVQVVEVESLCRTSLIRVCHGELLLFVQPRCRLFAISAVPARSTLGYRVGNGGVQFLPAHTCPGSGPRARPPASLRPDPA